MTISSSQPFAGVGITYARREEAEAERQHDNVQHGMFLCDGIAGATEMRSRTDSRALMVVKCHRAHRFSRRERKRRYRNLIKVPVSSRRRPGSITRKDGLGR